MLKNLFKKNPDPTDQLWRALQAAQAGSLVGASRIHAVAILYENPRDIALPENRRLAGILIEQYRSPDFIPHSLALAPETQIVARKLAYGTEIGAGCGLDSAGSNKLLAEMLAAAVDVRGIPDLKAMAFTGDSPALGQSFFALLSS